MRDAAPRRRNDVRKLHAAIVQRAPSSGATHGRLSCDRCTASAQPSPATVDVHHIVARKTAGQRASRIVQQRHFLQPPPRNVSPKQQPSAAHRARLSRDNRASARAHALGREAPPRKAAAQQPN
ncbi:hypothetical protein F511_30393 [Dorcoceras hygrometricum]|uniref:Uncharacterized protein n=1 Tax=Dorcoceras hygrometricum TaxID=472368 RepID=A0A2Z7BHB5_9LAMI|nr:hypothetical protein F511_30393 [Dorcoceras hygrometricum]